MSFLKFNPKLESYWSPILKIIISIPVFILLANRRMFFDVHTPILKVADAIFGFTVGSLLILRFYISLAELITVYENKANMKLKKADTRCLQSKVYDTAYIADIIRNNTINDIVILLKKGVIHIGSSSDYRAQTDEFFDKKYYIEDDQYTNYESFLLDFEKLVEGTKTLNVVSIDGVMAKKLKP